jgi:hypothetical protein
MKESEFYNQLSEVPELPTEIYDSILEHSKSRVRVIKFLMSTAAIIAIAVLVNFKIAQKDVRVYPIDSVIEELSITDVSDYNYNLLNDL